MKRNVWGLLVGTLLLPFTLAAFTVDHDCVDLVQVPNSFLQKARQDLRVSFGHGPLASQIVIGLQALKDVNPVLYSFSFGREVTPDSLSLWNQIPPGDLGNPDSTTWAERTEKLLTTVGKDRNVVIWAWGSQLSSAPKSEVQKYLRLMHGLEKKFPHVKFVYMTGPLDGSGENGELHKRNEQIRKYCSENDKILFDMADIESYSPNGKVNFVKYNATHDGTFAYKGKRRSWPDEWLARNSDTKLELPNKASYSHPLIANLQARAFWWMMARIAGWSPPEKPMYRGKEKESEEPKTISPVPRAAAPVKETEKISGQTRLYRFDKIQDYRFWSMTGAKGTLIPEKGSGMLTPVGKPGAAMHGGLLCIEELEFRARLEKGGHVCWFINTDWNESMKPAVGIGGVYSEQSCMLIVNGEMTKYKNPVPIDQNEHRFQIWTVGNRLCWSIDRKIVVERELPEKLINHQGSLVLGGWNAVVRINGVYIKSK